MIDPYDHFNCQKLLCASAKIQTVGYWVKTLPLCYPDPNQIFVHFTDNHFIFVLFSALCLLCFQLHKVLRLFLARSMLNGDSITTSTQITEPRFVAVAAIADIPHIL